MLLHRVRDAGRPLLGLRHRPRQVVRQERRDLLDNRQQLRPQLLLHVAPRDLELVARRSLRRGRPAELRFELGEHDLLGAALPTCIDADFMSVPSATDKSSAAALARSKMALPLPTSFRRFAKVSRTFDPDWISSSSTPDLSDSFVESFAT